MKQKAFFLVWQVLSFKLKKQTSKNVVDTTFKDTSSVNIIQDETKSACFERNAT